MRRRFRRLLNLTITTGRIVLAAGIVVGLAACSSSYSSLSHQADASRNTLAWLEHRYGFVHLQPLDLLLERVTEQLAGSIFRAALERNFHRDNTEYFRSFPWQVFVLDAEAANAFSLGAGVIVVTRGILERAYSEAAFAAVVAHEMGHQMLGHTAEALQAVSSGEPAPHGHYTLSQEIEADTLGLKLLHVAGYSINCAAEALTIDYRAPGEDVSGVPPRWLELRMANIAQELREYPPHLPANMNSREFAHVQRRLAGL